MFRELGEILQQIARRQVVHAVPPERDLAPPAAPGALRQDFHLLVFIDDEHAVERANGRRLEVAQVAASKRPMDDAALPSGQLPGRDLDEAQDAAHGKHARGKRRDPIFFGRHELQGEAIYLLTARYEVGERAWCWSFNELLHGFGT